MHRSPPSTRSLDRRALGTAAENRAALLLQQHGFQLIARNLRCRLGELDLVARRDDLLLVVEVRLRSGAAFGGAAASITAGKQRRLKLAARYLLATQPRLAALSWRFDAIVVSGVDGPVEWIEAAFV